MGNCETTAALHDSERRVVIIGCEYRGMSSINAGLCVFLLEFRKMIYGRHLSVGVTGGYVSGTKYELEGRIKGGIVSSAQ